MLAPHSDAGFRDKQPGCGKVAVVPRRFSTILLKRQPAPPALGLTNPRRQPGETHMSRLQLSLRSLVLGLLALNVAAVATVLDAGPNDEPINPKWLDKLKPIDRAAVAHLLGYAPPKFDDRLMWFESDPLHWEDLRGKIVVIQSWSHKSSGGRSGITRAQRILDSLESEDIVLLALHTPENVDQVEPFLERKKMKVPVAVDPIGAYCDELGVYKRPVNIIVDRQGAVRAAGLNARGLKSMLGKLIAEPYDPESKPQAMPEPEEAEEVEVEFPKFGGQVSAKKDLRGRRAPDFHVSEWVTTQPDATGKVVVIDFWATWCTPCRMSIPHMNKLATQFANDLCIVGLSNEKLQAFQSGMNKHSLRLTSFQYALALDSGAKMQNAVGVTGIPHCIVMSSDWIVRWQGHPAALRATTIQQIVAANRQLNAGGANARPRRWTGPND